jgi:hypothetical protein
MTMGETNGLPTAASVLQEAYALVSTGDAGAREVDRAAVMTSIAKELREGSVKLPVDARLLLSEVEDLRAKLDELRHDLESAETESAMWYRRAIAAEALGVGQTARCTRCGHVAELRSVAQEHAQPVDAPVSAPLFDATTAVTQTQIPVPALRPHEGECPACGTAVYEAQTSDGKEARHRITGTTQCPDYGREA